MKKIDIQEAITINGGGWLYDLYKIVLEEKDDFVRGLNESFNNGIL